MWSRRPRPGEPLRRALRECAPKPVSYWPSCASRYSGLRIRDAKSGLGSPGTVRVDSLGVRAKRGPGDNRHGEYARCTVRADAGSLAPGTNADARAGSAADLDGDGRGPAAANPRGASVRPDRPAT